jgi:hypothetical protein
MCVDVCAVCCVLCAVCDCVFFLRLVGVYSFLDTHAAVTCEGMFCAAFPLGTRVSAGECSVPLSLTRVSAATADGALRRIAAIPRYGVAIGMHVFEPCLATHTHTHTRTHTRPTHTRNTTATTKHCNSVLSPSLSLSLSLSPLSLSLLMLAVLRAPSSSW